MHCLVLLNTRSPGIQNGLTYETGEVLVQPGSLVKVPLRKKSMEGIVIETGNKTEEQAFDAKPVEALLGREPLLSAAQLQTVRWMAGKYFCSLRAALTPFLPASPWRNALPKEQVFFRLAQEPDHMGAKQKHIVALLRGKDGMSKEEILQKTESSPATLNVLLKKGIVVEEKHAHQKTAVPSSYPLLEQPPALTPIQQRAYEALKKETRPSLLFGITGSGKTEVYATLIADQAKRGKQSILLVPEILLTEHTIHRFARMFERSSIAVLHSRLTPAARRNEWQRIHHHDVALVIGSRSALFAPCRNLGLVIIDEEHEWTYKNEQSPRYNTRDAAETLCRFSDAKLVLGSATPSLEAWQRAKTGTYALVPIPERFQNRPLPSVTVVDLGAVKFGSLYPFSPTLLQAMEVRLQKKEQSVLFLNRRGMASGMLCLECRRRLVSPLTQLPFTVHKARDGKPYLLDHISGASASIPARCPQCGSTQLFPVGAGTQRLEELLRTVFPKARVLRADSDSLKHPEQMRDLLRSMRENEADILLGTQSVVKGLDLPGVTLAAVLVADIGMSLPHFRAGERVFQLLTQLTGRSGRTVPGDVIIQTFRPDALEVVAASKHRTEEYLDAELQLRTTLRYPPSTELIRFLVSGDNAESRAKTFHRAVQSAITEQMDARASVAPTLFGAGKEWHILLKGNGIHSLLSQLPSENITVDVDPVDVA